MLDLTPDQINQMQSLGINIDLSQQNNLPQPPAISIFPVKPKSTSTNRIIPLLSLSGLTILSFGGILLFKGKDTANINSPPPIEPVRSPIDVGGPTQVPKSIQHYLLTSQQYFTQALQLQQNCTGNPSGCPSPSPTQVAELINKSILTASESITAFPTDYRGYEQRGRIYLSLVDSQPQLLTAAISDLSYAAKLNPNSAEITRSLASLYARQGDVQNTLSFLSQTVNLEPTKAQNFYDLAKLQQQSGLLPQALDTYNRLLTIIADPTQKIAVETEKSALEKLVAQSPAVRADSYISPSPKISQPSIPVSGEGPLLQAILLPTGLPIRSSEGTQEGLIIAAPETSKNITVNSLADSNSLSDTATLPANTPQITIQNTNLTTSAQVYLTITKGGKNQTLQILSRSKESFTVGLDTPITEDIEFKWWIVK